MFNEKVCIITGGSKGIGLMIAEEFKNNGAQVILADSDEEYLKAEAIRLKASYFVLDFTNKRQCKELIDFALSKFGRVDILINCVNTQFIKSLEGYPEEKWDEMIDLLLSVPFYLTRYVWDVMKKQKWGRIIYFNSIHGLVASKNKVAYVSAKHGLSGLTKSAALEGGEHGITVNSICPSYVDTPGVREQIDFLAKEYNMNYQEVIERLLLKEAPIKRLIEPSKVVEAVKYISSDAADYITGSTFTLDGGYLIS